jgi:hypothetical protein
MTDGDSKLDIDYRDANRQDGYSDGGGNDRENGERERQHDDDRRREDAPQIKHFQKPGRESIEDRATPGDKG